MHVAIFIANFMFGSLFNGVCYGALVNEDTTSGRGSRQYTVNEEWFIINQLRNYPSKYLPIWGQDMWTEIANNHCKMRESDPYIFPPRTDVALARYFQRKMLHSKGNLRLPEDLILRIPKRQKKKPGDPLVLTDRSANEQPNLTSEAVGKRSAHLREIDSKNKFTLEEDEFIIKFVKNHPGKPVPVGGHKIWIEAAEQLREIRKSNPSQFPLERSASSLRERFRRIHQQAQKKRLKITYTATEDEEVLDADRVLHRYTEAEDQFVIEELLKPTCTRLYSLTTWRKIKEQHDNKVKSKAQGFDQYRPVAGLKQRFISHIMKPANQVPPALQKKFPKNFPKSQGKRSRLQRYTNCAVRAFIPVAKRRKEPDQSKITLNMSTGLDDTPSEFKAGETSHAQNTDNEDSALWDFAEFGDVYEMVGEAAAAEVERGAAIAEEERWAAVAAEEERGAAIAAEEERGAAIAAEEERGAAIAAEEEIWAAVAADEERDAATAERPWDDMINELLDAPYEINFDALKDL